MAAQDINEFELARRRAQQESVSGVQRQKDALTRRFAQMGNLNSGARLKLEQQAEQEGQKQLQSANEGIDTAERAEARRVREIQEGRDFSRSEREASQGFASGQADLARKFQTGERLGSQDFSGQQAALQRSFITGERIGGQDFARGERIGSQEFASQQADVQRQFAAGESDLSRRHDYAQQDLARQHQQKQFDAQLGLSRDQYRTSMEQFDRTFGEEVRINNKNIDFAERMLNEKGFADKLMGGDIGRVFTDPINYRKELGNKIIGGIKGGFR